EPDLEVLEACRDLKEAGYRLALDDFVDAPRSLPLLAYADCVKVDFRRLAHACDPHLIQRMRRHEVHMLAEKVESHPEHRHAMDAGYDLFQGYYYCRPQMIETRDLPPSKLSRLRFLAAVTRDDASFDELEEVFREDVGLTVRLLRYLNSAAFGWRYEIGSLHHALALMGLQPLRKWATMMGFVALAEDRPHELAVTSLTRARFAEQLGPPSGLAQHELELFLTGMLSTAEAMIGRPLAEVLGGLAVPDTVKSALTGAGSPLDPVIEMVTSYECGDWPRVESVRETCALDDASLSAAYVSSLRWAEAAARV
ncbi:MAG TPA: HDOD domain-containing protein, partial [Dongiaceae bacterium]|nr:HDOD domain-containing protein [Dongiaceae bacterium]